jgi:hypothetical protein
VQRRARLLERGRRHDVRLLQLVVRRLQRAELVLRLGQLRARRRQLGAHLGRRLVVRRLELGEALVLAPQRAQLGVKLDARLLERRQAGLEAVGLALVVCCCGVLCCVVRVFFSERHLAHALFFFVVCV